MDYFTNIWLHFGQIFSAKRQRLLDDVWLYGNDMVVTESRRCFLLTLTTLREEKCKLVKASMLSFSGWKNIHRMSRPSQCQSNNSSVLVFNILMHYFEAIAIYGYPSWTHGHFPMHSYHSINMWNNKIKSKHGNNPKHISITEIEPIVMSAQFPEEAHQGVLKSHKEILKASIWLHYWTNDTAIGFFT